MRILAQVSENKSSRYYLELRRPWDHGLLVGPFTDIPLIIKESTNEYGIFYDLKIGTTFAHIIIDPSGMEHCLVEMRPEPYS